MLTYFPLPFAIYFEPATVKNQMQRSFRPLWQSHVYRSASSGKGRMIRYVETDLQNTKNGAHKSFCCTVRQMLDFFHHQPTLNGFVALSKLFAALLRPFIL